MNLLFLTFVFPLVGFLLLSFSRGRFSENLSALIGVGSVGLSAATAAYVIWQLTLPRLKAAPIASCCGNGCRWTASRRTSPCT